MCLLTFMLYSSKSEATDRMLAREGARIIVTDIHEERSIHKAGRP